MTTDRRLVWLASFPKSGNTWFRAVAVAWHSGEHPDLHRLRAPGIATIASGRPRIEHALGIPTSLMTADEIDLLRPHVDDVIAGHWGRFPGEIDDDAPDDTVPLTDELPPGTKIRIAKIHDALFTGPTGEPIVSTTSTAAAIYVVRDPRDVALSYAHHYDLTHADAVTAMAGPELRLDSTRDRLLPQVRQRMGSWSRHAQSWLDQSWFPVHVVRYEDCHHDPVGTFTDALRFAGFDARPDDVATAVEAARFDRLAAQEQEAGFVERSPHTDRFFRRGDAGAWRDELDPELADRIVRDHGPMMTRLGYETT